VCCCDLSPYTQTRSAQERAPSRAPPPAPAPASARAHAAGPRPGPPSKVAVPVLLLALVCFAVGFWALSRS
ncbi:serine/threonine protein kinase, partial [Streptomyces bomunensis]|nr:serine/threonine protein kinase [Streptomyces montanisoli]